MSLGSVLARIGQIQASFPAPVRTRSDVPTTARAFDSVLNSALDGAARVGSITRGGDVGNQIVAAARAEIGQAESPNGSNDSRRISDYRGAVEWNPVGPWCAYFASWAAREAGAPLGERGQGFARVADVWSWAQRSGRAVGPAERPAPGDLVIMDHHMGIVEAVLPDGRVQTIEGNKDNKVSRVVRDPSEFLGFVKVG